MDSKLLKDVGFFKKDGETVDEEVLEVIDGTYEKTGFPSSLKYYHLSWEVFDLRILTADETLILGGITKSK